jgi:hypothetical protein
MLSTFNNFSFKMEDSPTMNNASELRVHEFEKALPKTEGVEAAERLNKVVTSIVHQV